MAGVAPYVESFGLAQLRGTNQRSHVFIRGVHPELEEDVSNLAQYMQVGQLSDLNATFASPDGGGEGLIRACFVGRQFPGFAPEWSYYDTERLNVDPGWIVVITASPGLERSVKLCAVNGLFESSYYDYDRQFVIMGLDSAMDLVQSDGAVSGLSLKLDDYSQADQVRARLRDTLSPGALLVRLGGAGADASPFVLSGDGARAAALAPDGQAVVWAVADGQPVKRQAGSGAACTALDLATEGDGLFMGLSDGSVALVSESGRERTWPAPEEGDSVTALRVSPDAWTVAVGHASGIVRLLDLEEGEEPTVVARHTGPVNVLAFDRFGDVLLTAGGDGRAWLWTLGEDIEAGPVLPTVSGAPVTSAAFSPDGKRLITGDEDGGVVLWDVASGEAVLYGYAHKSVVLAVCFGGAADEVLTAGPEEVRMWRLAEVEGGREAMLLERIIAAEDAPIEAAAFREDGARVLTVGAVGGPRLRYSGPAFAIKTWEEQQKTFLEAVAMEQFLQVLIMSLILVLAEFFIFALLTTMVNERRRDIGILKAVGLTPGQICAVFLIIGLAIGVTGGLLGAGAGVLFTDNINAIRCILRDSIGFDPFPPDVYYFKEIPTHIGVLTPTLTAGGAILCSLLFSIFPALRAARLDPVRTLHYE